MPAQTPLLILFTGDFYLRRRKIDALINQLISKDNRSFNLCRIDVKEIGIQNLILQARSLPMLGEKQVFWIEDLSHLKKENLASFEEYWKNPVKSSYFILEANELEKESPILKLILKFGTRVDSLENEKRAGIDMIHKKFKSENRTITKEAWQYLEEKTGGNLMLINSCAEKLLLYTDQNSTVDLEMTKKLADEFLAYDAFDLTNAICDKNPEKALRVFHFLYELEGDATAVVGLLNWQLRQIWQTKVLYEEKGEREMQRILRISPYRLPYFLKQVARFSFEELESAIQKLFDLDWKSKTGAFNSRISLESLILELSTNSKRERKSLLGGVSR